ncbi:YihY/virulence factor BrkB family protein [Haloarcula nitratireducens]|uniref:YihY/virulence factor BrkB family protein n=1 Tax=Haloarcula nitratireducens TaxID=2487749 RepID=A0AAW4PB86_9EURY|nr:YihY/virulence factor BrkB family protein [Halomicroarcula nitratireducens]MBX0295129.1 YihY/virulence factor BrkB family protein [Halomicroarcula nitratireducens]
MELSGVKATGKQVVSEFTEKNVPFMAAGIAYNAFVSLAPLLVLLLIVTTTFGTGLEDRIVSVAQSSLPAPIADLVEQVFSGGASSAGTSAISLVVLLWGSLKVFRGLDTAFSEIYESTADSSIVDSLQDGLVVFVSLVVGVLGTVAASAAFAGLADRLPLGGYVMPLVLLGGLVAAFFPMYYVFPDADLSWRQVLPGTVVAAVGWAVFQSLFQIYLSVKGGGTTSLFGGVLLIVTWLYFSSIVLLIGTVINAVISGHATGDPGGVGAGASKYTTERETTLTRGELRQYLADFQTELAGGYEPSRDGPGTDTSPSHPWPRDDVELTESSSVEGGQKTRTVVLRWHPDDDAESDGHGSTSTDSPDRQSTPTTSD